MRALVAIGVMGLALAGCLDDAPSQSDDGGPGGGKITQDGSDAGMPADMTALPPDLMPPPDLFPADIAGMVNCFGTAICDPTMMFCIRFHDGNQGTPGKLVGGPACYSPGDPCADNNQNMDCGCIQNDATLGVNCQGSCVDNGDGTYDCYAQQ